MKKDEKKPFNIRFTPEEREFLRKEAFLLDTTRSELIRQLVQAYRTSKYGLQTPEGESTVDPREV